MIDPVARPPVGPHSLEAASDPDPPPSRAGVARLLGFVEEVEHFVASVDLPRAGWGLTRWLPSFTFSRTRARLLAIMGSDIDAGTAFTGYVHLVGRRGCARRLRVHPGCILGPGVILGLDADITLGKNVSIGPMAMLYTATHPLGVASRRMQLNVLARPIVVEDGAWIGMRALVMPGVRIGRGAVVSAGAVVTKDVPDNVLVAGNPATIVQELSSR
jgi:acetyltransferase-like isoleucine patch superfamily enzyme